MAKTRAQTRKEESEKKLAKNLKKKSTKKGTIRIGETVLKSCTIRLERIDLNTVNNVNRNVPKNAENGTKKYDLRTKNLCSANNSQAKVVPPKSIKQIVAISQAALHTAKAIRIWENIKKQHTKDILTVSQLVCARMSGHRPWPAKILKFQKNGIQLKFYGTNETGTVKRAEVVAYFPCKDVVDEYLKVPMSDLSSRTLDYHMKYIKAVKEVSCI